MANIVEIFIGLIFVSRQRKITDHKIFKFCWNTCFAIKLVLANKDKKSDSSLLKKFGFHLHGNYYSGI